MPQVVAGAALAGVFAGSSLATLSIGFSLSAFAGSLILGGLSYALTPKPKNSSSIGQGPQPGTVAVRQSDLTRTYLYGHTRVVRGYAHMASTNNNRDLHLILMLCEGEVRAINEIWVDDYCIPPDWIDSNGNVTQGRYAGYLKIYKHLGAVDQLADEQAVLNMPEWTADHRLQGIAYIYAVMIKNQDVYPTGVPNLTAIVEGPTMYDPRTEAQTWTTNLAIHAYDYITRAEAYSSDIQDTDTVNVGAQANICDEIVTVEAENFDVTAIDTSTNIITLEGDLLTLQFGDQVQISSDGSVPSGLSAATNYYVIPYQIKTTPRIMLAETLDDAMGKVAIDITSAGSGAIVITKNGEPRYHGSGVIDSANQLNENLNNLVTCMAGRAINIAGAWTLLAGAWRTPVVDLGIDDMRGTGFAVKNCLSMSDSYNVVKGLFSGPGTLYQDSDYPSAQYNEFISQDLGVIATKEVNLPFSTRPNTAQRIAKIELFRGRQEIALTCDFSTKAMQVQPGDNVTLTVARLGWDEKEFEVTAMSLDCTPNGLINKLTLRETAQEIFDWTSGEAIHFDPAPNTNLPNPFEVQVPGGLRYDSRYVETRDGDLFYTLQLSWNEHPDAFVREYGDYQVRFRLYDDTNGPEDNWLPGFFVDGSLTQSDITSASVGTRYDLQIRARNNLGVRSGWSTIYGAIVGSSGGVTVSDDWELVTDTISVYKDWGSVADSPTSTEDFGYVV